MTNLLVIRNNDERGNVTGVFGKSNRPFDFRWGGRDCWFNGENANNKPNLSSLVELLFDLCKDKMQEQGIEDDGEFPFMARIEGRKVTKLIVLDPECEEAEYEKALKQI